MRETSNKMLETFLWIVIILIAFYCFFIAAAIKDKDGHEAKRIRLSDGQILKGAIFIKRRGKWEIDTTDEFINTTNNQNLMYHLEDDKYLILYNKKPILLTLVDTYNIKSKSK